MVWDHTGLTEWINKEETLGLGLLDARKVFGLEHEIKAKTFKKLYDNGVQWGKVNFMFKPTIKKWINRKQVQQQDDI